MNNSIDVEIIINKNVVDAEIRMAKAKSVIVAVCEDLIVKLDIMPSRNRPAMV